MSHLESETAAPAAEEVPKTLKEEIMELYAKRTETENKVRGALDFLDSTPVGMYEPLIDAEGFPRNDCDLFAVRTARNTVICGRTDLRMLEEALYDKLGELHEGSKEEAEAQMAVDEAARRQRKAELEAQQRRLAVVRQMAELAPLLRVAEVEPTSPAAEAGLQRGFLVVQYGDVNADNLASKGGLGAIATTTKEKEGSMLSVWVREGDDPSAEPKELFIVPQSWAGKGLLGCALDPI